MLAAFHGLAITNGERKPPEIFASPCNEKKPLFEFRFGECSEGDNVKL
tara:strand:- start:416 stop:559 length:144 start_codon:yes stop_codon:yes gene_type:complete